MDHPVQRVAAVVGLVVGSPFLAIGALAVKFSSRGPIIFKASRVGCEGTSFTMFKLRTMHTADSPGSVITAGSDPRVFEAGRWLRRLKIDELPQLVNVIQGDMVFIGPRPEAPSIVQRFYRPWMWETLSVPPGVVGPGSLGYFREELEVPTDAEEAARYYSEVLLPRKLARDLVYVRCPSFGYRAELVTRTLLGVVGLGHLLRKRVELENARAAVILREVQQQ